MTYTSYNDCYDLYSVGIIYQEHKNQRLRASSLWINS